MVRYFIILFISTSCIASIVNAQEDTTRLNTIQLDEFIFTANKFQENKKNIVQPIQLINKKQMQWYMSQTTAGLLEQTGNVFMQRSQAGGGSAVLRGFEASRVVMVVDGVRMNNAIYRTGHLQNIITIDNNILDRIEILYGSSSTLYGSDALGGAIIFTTLQPKLSGSTKLYTSTNGMVRYSSAFNEATAHTDINLSNKKIASLTSITYSKFGDLRKGNFSNPFYDSFGRRSSYVERINGVDSIVPNSDPNLQKNSGYSQVDILEKILFRQNEHISHTLNFQYSNSSNIPRYDRLTDVRNGALRYAEWYYGPQARLMTAYQVHATDLHGFFNEIKVGLNYQAIEESRYQRDRGKNGLQSRIENVGVLGYNIDLRKFSGRHEITVGTDGQYNAVRSMAHTRNIITNVKTPLDTRYPDGGSNMLYASLYAQHFYKIIPGKLILNDGIRFNYTDLNASFNDKTFYPFPFSEARQHYFAWSGNLGFVYMPANNWRFTLSGSTGFRSPNVDDLAKVFESAGGANLVVPNPDLKPEHTYNADLGVIYFAGNILKIEANGFYTWFRDAIILDKFQLNGSDSVIYNGTMTSVVASQNKAKAYIYGFNAAITAKLISNVTLYSTINFTFGRYYNIANVEVPLDHIPPVFGKTSISYEQKRFSAEVYAMYNGWKYLKDYSSSGEDNLVYATDKGMPSWYTLNLRAKFNFNTHIATEIALENIFDYNYRIFASGISAPGRNFVFTLHGRF